MQAFSANGAAPYQPSPTARTFVGGVSMNNRKNGAGFQPYPAFSEDFERLYS